MAPGSAVAGQTFVSKRQLPGVTDSIGASILSVLTTAIPPDSVSIAISNPDFFSSTYAVTTTTETRASSFPYTSTPTRTASGVVLATSPSVPSSAPSTGSRNPLSTSAKIGIGIGISAFAWIVIAMVGCFILGRRKGRRDTVPAQHMDLPEYVRPSIANTLGIEDQHLHYRQDNSPQYPEIMAVRGALERKSDSPGTWRTNYRIWR
ncbi:uncharacterized protein BDR25DRAFT_316214 [Lindgomyces ingoldianus]|uniref:Uncharacterized protein n=1 Tax=Lindgomyces ingoldianus TaxID=673940 RepID=A0ACB6QNB4_9PLEO|nr:uncharacterized protein BDR25DRAFT_316214 [Lindgomyces ingoldianus]KAF2468068.1 hypothetical protein BDR25DRAFT_316214 [Lindgomyces ingoldianus]